MYWHTFYLSKFFLQIFIVLIFMSNVHDKGVVNSINLSTEHSGSGGNNYTFNNSLSELAINSTNLSSFPVYPGLSFVMLLLSVISILTSVLLYVTVWKNEEFHTTSYAIIVNLNFSQLLMVISGQFIPNTLSLFHLYIHRFTLPYWLALASSNTTVGVYQVMLLNLLLCAIQRYTAVAHYATYYRQYFTKVRPLLILFGLLWPVSVIAAIPCSIGPCQFWYDLDLITSLANYDHPATQGFFLYNMISNGVVGLSVLLLYVLMLISYRALKISPSRQQKKLTNHGFSFLTISKELRFSLQLLVITGMWLYGVLQYNIIAILSPQMMASTTFGPQTTQALLKASEFVLFLGSNCDVVVYFVGNRRLRICLIKNLFKEYNENSAVNPAGL